MADSFLIRYRCPRSRFTRPPPTFLKTVTSGCPIQSGTGRAYLHADYQSYGGGSEERISALEGGSGAIATASGQSALFLTLMTLLDQGSHIVSSTCLYGGSVNLLKHTLPRFGIETSFVHPRDLDGFRQAIRPETGLFSGKSLAIRW